MQDPFNEWWLCLQRHLGDQADGPVMNYLKQAFEAGREYERAHQAQARQGSSLRGRTIKLFRPLTGQELAREGWRQELLWPALELDDSTVVYSSPQPPYSVDRLPSLYGQRPGKSGEVERVAFELEVTDVTLEA